MVDGVPQEPGGISLTEKRWATLRRIGRGNYSAGVRVLLDWWDETHGKGK